MDDRDGNGKPRQSGVGLVELERYFGHIEYREREGSH
jgi:hypothetical protein